ncbi:MAG: hypothetical protein F6K24_30455 [Okeania sp. SIO2D1]|nr:hypothetical protein [Okeania sp. SIO2D1]
MTVAHTPIRKILVNLKIPIIFDFNLTLIFVENSVENYILTVENFTYSGKY